MKKSNIIFSDSQLELLGEFYRCELPVYQFAEEKGIARSTFGRWIRIFEGVQPRNSPMYEKEESLQSVGSIGFYNVFTP